MEPEDSVRLLASESGVKKFRYYDGRGQIKFEGNLREAPCAASDLQHPWCSRVTQMVHPYCAECTKRYYHVEIRPSSLLNAGLGLFAVDVDDPSGNRVVFKKHELIAPYCGELLTEDTMQQRYSKSVKEFTSYIIPYAVLLTSDFYLDGALYRGPATYTNDARNATLNNAFLVEGDDDQLDLYAKVQIRNGMEIFTSYGKAYWGAKPRRYEIISL
jgi:hypothetical protein